ncbi:cholinesterase 1-like [Lytechinus pictus]|uniref:cholinesterase 1-like n=1 Tax=Lytechinus pictus TaxID=7653 RepID=UPI00240D1EEE|nr:cholinesterase 1-like [Lytechinus pictus]
MKMRFLSIILLALIVAIKGESPRVTVNEGTLVGKTVEFSENQFINVTKNIDMFLGVPFASPPRRFSPPEPMTSWSGERNATEFSPACQQDPSNSLYYPITSEDCLYLNVYTPSPKPSGIPVMVWIHGGGFVTGSAMTYSYYGVPLVAVGDVIMVSINYRLAIFAHLTTGDSEAPGNIGMLDQVAALEWIYNNIESFGGDKDRITIFGESAGAASVGFHVLSKLSRPYFSQAIYQSGTVFNPWSFKNDPSEEIENSQDLGRSMGCDDVTSSASLVSCLRDVDPIALGQAADQVYGQTYPVTLDGVFLDDTPTNLYEKGDFANVPIMIGFNKDEGTLYVLQVIPESFGSPIAPHINRTYFEIYVRSLMIIYERNDEIVNDAVFQEYIDWTMADDPTADYFRSMVDFSGDFDFACSSDMVMRKHAQAGGTVYKYYMTHDPTDSIYKYGDIIPDIPWIGAGHGEDLTFVFGYPFIEELKDIMGHTLTDEEKALSVKMMKFWTNFAKSGNPSKSSLDGEEGEGEDFWPLYTIPELNHKEISLQLGQGRAIRARQCHFWNEYVPKLQVFSNSIDDEEKAWRESYNGWKDEMTEWQQLFDEYKKQPTCN